MPDGLDEEQLFPETEDERAFREFQDRQYKAELADGAESGRTRWVWPFIILFIIGTVIAFVGAAIALWALTLGGGCALGGVPSDRSRTPAPSGEDCSATSDGSRET